MISEFALLCEELTQALKDSYQQGVSLEDAEKLAGKFLYAEILVSDELRKADLNSRVRKQGVKALRAALYMEEAKKTDKKPSDTWIEAAVNMNELTSSEQNGLDEAEIERDRLQSYFNIFKEGHIFMRGIAKGRFDA